MADAVWATGPRVTGDTDIDGLPDTLAIPLKRRVMPPP
jgi:hypothetical protein